MTVSAYNQELPRRLPFRRAGRAYGDKYFVFIDIGCCVSFRPGAWRQTRFHPKGDRSAGKWGTLMHLDGDDQPGKSGPAPSRSLLGRRRGGSGATVTVSRWSGLPHACVQNF